MATGSFAVAVGPVTLYGLAADGTAEVLGLDAGPVPDAGPPAELTAGLGQLLGAFGLVIVDWCRLAVVGPASVAAYLSD